MGEELNQALTNQGFAPVRMLLHDAALGVCVYIATVSTATPLGSSYVSVASWSVIIVVPVFVNVGGRAMI